MSRHFEEKIIKRKFQSKLLNLKKNIKENLSIRRLRRRTDGKKMDCEKFKMISFFLFLSLGNEKVFKSFFVN